MCFKFQGLDGTLKSWGRLYRSEESYLLSISVMASVALFSPWHLANGLAGALVSQITAAMALHPPMPSPGILVIWHLDQGQARGYGRITHFFVIAPRDGHDFYKADDRELTGDLFQMPGCRMKI